MLLGCCHCGEEPPSESVPSASESLPSIDGSSDGAISTDPLVCGACAVVPAKWVVTLSGWTGSALSHQSCCDSMNRSYLMKISSRAFSPCNLSGTDCRIWESDEKVFNLSTNLGTTPTCAPQTFPRVVLAMSAPFSPTTSIVVSVMYGGLGVFGTAAADCFSYTFTTGAGCFYNGNLTWFSYSSLQRRCNYGTVTVRPA